MPKIILIFYSYFSLSSLISHLSLSLIPFPLFLPLLYPTFSYTTWHWASCTRSKLTPDRSSHFLYHTFLDTNSAETTGTVCVAFVWKSPVSSLWCKVQKPDMDFSPSLPLSPCRLPVLGATQANLSVACRAFATEPIFLWRAVGVDWVCLA